MNAPRIGSLFSGAGMLDEGVRSVLGGTVSWHSEVDPAACKVLAHRYPDVPNLGDVTAVDWSRVEPVDVITGGSPCQDVSHAGKRAGMTEGTRSNLWVAMREAIAALRPNLVIWENVRGVYSACADSAMGRCPRCVDPDSTVGHAPYLRALGRVVGDLSSLGYRVQWHGLRAADVGAPHGRFRVFVVAWSAADTGAVGRHGVAGEFRGRRDTAVGSEACDHPGDEGCGAATDASGGSLSRLGATRDGLRLAAERRDGSAADAGGRRREGCGRPQGHEPDARWGVRTGSAAVPSGTAWGQYEPAIRRWEARLGRLAPSPTETGPKGGQRLSPRFTEWMMGWPDGWVTDTPGVSRNDALKICGNGVVWLQAAEALRRILATSQAVAA